MRQIVKRNIAGRSIDPTGNLSIGFDQQGGYPSANNRPGNLCYIVITESLGARVTEFLHQCSQSRQKAGLKKLPGAYTEFVDRRQGIRVDIDAFVYQEWVGADFVKQVMMLGKCCEDQRQTRWLGVALKNPPVNGAKKTFRINVSLRLFPSVTMPHGRLGSTCAAI